MSEIPADVMKTAQSVYAGLHANNYDADCADYERDEDVIEIALAILAERERCAQIIEKNMLCENAHGNEVLHPRGNSGNKVGLEYAAAIRKGIPEP